MAFTRSRVQSPPAPPNRTSARSPKSQCGNEPATGGSKGVRPLRGERASRIGPLSKSRQEQFQARTDEGARFDPRQLHQTALRAYRRTKPSSLVPPNREDLITVLFQSADK